MKIVCDRCGTKYSIDDRRVAGKSFKVRCKQCAHILILPGPRAPTAEPAAPGTWHAVIDGIPRPIAIDDLRQLRATGVLDDRTLVWREGFDDWRELGGVDELREAGPVSVEVAPDTEAPGRPAPHAHAEAAGGLEPAPLRGVRHETSVLFSLSNLAQLAAPAPATASPAARTEGSGLLDIRSLARTRAPARSEPGPVAELPVFGALAFGEPAVLIPSRPPRRDRRLIWALAATAGALAIMMVTVVVLLMRGAATARADAPAVPQAPPGAAISQPPPAAPTDDPAAPTAVAHAGPEGAPATAPAEASTARSATRPDGAAPSSATHGAPTDAASPAEHPGTPARPAATSRRASTRPPASASASVAPRPTAAAASPAHPDEACPVVTCIVNDYADPCCAKYRQPAGGGAHPPAPAPRADLPDSLDRDAVASGLSRIDTRGCGQQSTAHGDVKVAVKVSPAGAVTDVTVKSSPDPALDACVTAAVRKGAFPATQHGGSFAYVWRF